jgi:hypothetical protein
MVGDDTMPSTQRTPEDDCNRCQPWANERTEPRHVSALVCHGSDVCTTEQTRLAAPATMPSCQ